MPARSPISELATFAHAIQRAMRDIASGEAQNARLDRLQRCFHNWMAREHLPSHHLREIDHVHQRCRETVACIPCHAERQQDEADDIMVAYEVALESSHRLRPSILTVRGPDYPIAHAMQSVDDAVRQWQAFSKRSPFSSATLGDVRGLALSIDHAVGTLHTTTRVLFVGERAISARPDEWAKSWNRGARGHRFQVTDIRQLERHDHASIDQYVRELAAVGINPMQLCEPTHPACDPAKLRVLQDALRSRRLINYRGRLSRTDDRRNL
jgi:hypothetical protein